MRKLIATINMTVDGFCDHTSMIADEEIHEHFSDTLRNASAVLYGRTAYHLMQSFWPTIVAKPSGTKTMDDFALAIDDVHKLVFSHTLKDTDPTITGWRNVRLAKRSLKDEVLELRGQSGKDIFAGSPSLIVQLTQLNLVDEYQLCVHPVIAGSGLPLFKNINDKGTLKLLKTKTFGSGAIMLYYQPIKK